MKNRILTIICLELLIPIIFLLISNVFFCGIFNETIYKFVLPVIVAILPIVFTWLCDKEIKIREEKNKELQ